MNNGIEITSQQSSAWSVVKALITFLLVLLLIGLAFGLMIYYVISKIQDDVVLTIMACVLSLGVILAAVSVASAAVYFIRRMGTALTEQTANNQQQLTNAFVQLVAETREAKQQNQLLINAVLQQAAAPAPLQLTGAKDKKQFQLGRFVDADGDGVDDDDDVEVWIKEGSSYKIVHHSWRLLDDFMRMPNPRREHWTHQNEDYGETARLIVAIEGSPLSEYAPNRWMWHVPHEQVMQWWQSAQQRGNSSNGNR